MFLIFTTQLYSCLSNYNVIFFISWQEGSIATGKLPTSNIPLSSLPVGSKSFNSTYGEHLVTSDFMSDVHLMFHVYLVSVLRLKSDVGIPHVRRTPHVFSCPTYTPCLLMSDVHPMSSHVRRTPHVFSCPTYTPCLLITDVHPMSSHVRRTPHVFSCQTCTRWHVCQTFPDTMSDILHTISYFCHSLPMMLCLCCRPCARLCFRHGGHVRLSDVSLFTLFYAEKDPTTEETQEFWSLSAVEGSTLYNAVMFW